MTFDLYATGVYKAVEKAGGVAKLAQLLGVTRQGCYPWVVRGYVPPKRALQIEQLYGIPRSELLDPRLKQTIAQSKNPLAKAGEVRYQSRLAPSKVAGPASGSALADDLV